MPWEAVGQEGAYEVCAGALSIGWRSVPLVSAVTRMKAFEDEEVAALMNANFVCIADRAPDLDEIHEPLAMMGEQAILITIQYDGAPFA